jgi:hypothetical protein
MKIIVLLVTFVATAVAQTPPPTKQTPPPGIQVPEPDRAELVAGVAALGKEIIALRGELKSKPALLALLPDVQIFHNAVRYALDYDEFFDAKQIPIARNLLALGSQRTKELRAGQPSWTAATGPVVRGYVSKIDGSVQPYGLSVPGDWRAGDKHARPLSFWLHGRSDNLSELAFISGQLKSKPEFTPGGGFVVQLYGRFCNASKFAGETDLFEAWENVRAQYPTDPQRVSVLGFSMGGASVWHLATHHAGLWCAASPGAGFAETAVYAKVFGEKKEPPPWWEQMLWRCYDATAYTGNLANTSLVAYSGEIDPQKQSADIMEEAMAGEGLKLERFIGLQTAHKYEPETKKKLVARIDELVTKGRPAMPPKVRFTTYTLRYNKMDWIEVDALEKHWERADVNAELVDEGTFRITTKNVAAFTIALPVAPAPLDKTHPPRLVIDGQELVGPPVKENWGASFLKTGDTWKLTAAPIARMMHAGARPPGLSKEHGLQGPIDDAFMDSFIFVRPTGKPLNDKIGAWAKSEMERAATEWRRVFRGEARVIDDKALSAADVANSNLVLWGDPSSNAVLAKILAKLPLTWTAEKLTLGTQSVSAADHAPVMIFPNPLNPQRYIVLNSGFTFREGSNTSNSQQTPKLPDWAVIDLKTPPDAKWPGLVVDAGFFDERWQFSAK